MSNEVWENKIVGYELVSADDLLANPMNARKHPAKQRVALRASLDTLGFVAPILVNRNTNFVIDGHARIEEALSKNDNMMIPVLYVDLTENEERQFLATFDYITYLAEYDNENLLTLMHGIDSDNEDIQRLLSDMAQEQGIVLDEPNTLDAEPQINLADELQKKWQTERGQVWEIPSKSGSGVHKIMCGDSTSAEDVARLMDGKHSPLLFTSPPYADMRDYTNDNDLDPQLLKSFIRVYKPHCDYQVVNLGIKRKDHEIVPYWDEYISEAKSCGLKLLSWNVWDRGSAVSIAQSTAMFAISHEWLFVFGDEPNKLNRTIPVSDSTKSRRKTHAKDSLGRALTTKREKDGSLSTTTRGEQTAFKQLNTIVFAYAEMGRTDLLSTHPARFSVDLVVPHIEAMTDIQDITIDPFLGSGTTLVACEQTGRTGYGMEISSAYVAVCLQRLSDIGLTPHLTNT